MTKIPYHDSSLLKPQDIYDIKPENSNKPFDHALLRKNQTTKRPIHPLKSYSPLDFLDQVNTLEPIEPPPFDHTPFKMVDCLNGLDALASSLKCVDEFAVDLEHNSYRSFQGMTCLMQISTRTEDFVVDTLKLRKYIGPCLRKFFVDPAKRKVMHGANNDVLWLQRDFQIYVVNLFDTHQASRALGLDRNSLEYLLKYFCNVTANKQYQLSDWRVRPLPEEMVKYAREDTHYLLNIYDQMKIKLKSRLLSVYKGSYDVCLQLYEKPMFDENSTYIQGDNVSKFSVAKGLDKWRDKRARIDDESTNYVMSDKLLISISKAMPKTRTEVFKIIMETENYPYLKDHVDDIIKNIKDSIKRVEEILYPRRVHQDSQPWRRMRYENHKICNWT